MSSSSTLDAEDFELDGLQMWAKDAAHTQVLKDMKGIVSSLSSLDKASFK